MVELSFDVAAYAVSCARNGNYCPLAEYVANPQAPITTEMRELLVEVIRRAKRLPRNRPSGTDKTLDGYRETADQVIEWMTTHSVKITPAVHEIAKVRNRSKGYVWNALRAVYPERSRHRPARPESDGPRHSK